MQHVINAARQTAVNPHAATKAPMTYDGQEISAKAGRFTIWIIRVTAEQYRVVTLDENTRRVPGWCTDFTPERIQIGTSVEEAARRLARESYRTHFESFEIHAPRARRARKVLAAA